MKVKFIPKKERQERQQELQKKKEEEKLNPDVADNTSTKKEKYEKMDIESRIAHF